MVLKKFHLLNAVQDVTGESQSAKEVEKGKHHTHL